MSNSNGLAVPSNDSTQFDNIEFEEEQNDLNQQDVKALNNEWKTFSKTLDNNKITQQTKDYLLEKGKNSLKSKKTNVELLAQVLQAKAETLQEQNKHFDFFQEKMELMQKQMELTQENMELAQKNMNLQVQLAQKQAMYDQKVAENNELFRANHELRFPGAYGKLRDAGMQAGAPQVKDTKVRTRGPEFTKKLNNGRGEVYGAPCSTRRNRFQRK